MRRQMEGAGAMGGPDDEAMSAMGYVWCRPHEEYHRPPECAVNEKGEPLMLCGCLWDLPEFHKRTCELWEPIYATDTPTNSE